MRVIQSPGERGSQRWIQRAVEGRWRALEDPIRTALGVSDGEIEWLSPRVDDAFAEYRDGAFLDRIGLDHLRPALLEFWPSRGPQWDALARSDEGQIILVEAKSHIGEFCSPATGAGDVSRARIVERLDAVATALGSRHGDRWPDQFYQYANRIAHLYFLRNAGVDAFLVLVGFLDDEAMRGPASAETWATAYRLADHTLGLPARHPLSRFIVHACPSVSTHD